MPRMADFCNLPVLPTEIWLLIAAYLSYSELGTLKSLNSFFLNCWLDTKWNLIVVYIQPDAFVRDLNRVVDPFLASRLKHLTIRLGHWPGRSTEDQIALITPPLDSLKLLPNIASLSVIVASEEIDPHVLATFFQTITSLSIATTLQDLSLNGPVEMYAWLYEYSAHCTPFGNLASLTLELDSFTTAKSSLLEPFFLSLSPTLQTLSLHNFLITLDLSPLFYALSQTSSQIDSSVFPNLNSLVLVLNLEESFPSSPESLRHFLLRHNNLCCLHLEIQDDELDVWLCELINDNYQLPSLQTLIITTPTSQPDLSALLNLLKRTAPTLSSLTLCRNCLTLKDAEKVVYALTTMKPEQPRKLKSLEMIVDEISVPFLDLLARKLPQLDGLTLYITQIQASFYDHLLLRQYDPNVTCSPADVLHTWKLHHLSVQFMLAQGGSPDAARVLHLVAGAVPALSRALGRRNE